MSYAVTDPDYSPYIARALYDPVRRPGPMTISLIAAAIVGIVGPMFILGQIGRLPDIDDQMQARPRLDLATLPVASPSRLEVMPEGLATTQVAYNYAPSSYFVPASAQYASADASDLIAALGEAQGADGSEAPADDPTAGAGPGQVLETNVASAPAADQVAMAEPAYPEPQGDASQHDYLVAVPDEELSAMQQ